MPTHKQQWNRRHGFSPNESHKIPEIAKISRYSTTTLRKVYNRGRGAWKTNIKSVRMKGSYRKGVDAPRSAKLSAEQWGMARVYSFVNKIEKGSKLNHDTDLR